MGYGQGPFPLGSSGYSTDRVAATSERPTGPFDVGAFRLRCPFSHFLFDDPIVYPGQPGRSHLHVFFGNTGVNANTTIENLTTTGNSTCNGGTVNRTGYWAPAMVDMQSNQVVKPEFADFYYKTGYRGVRPSEVQPFPRGLRMIAGDSMNRVGDPYNSAYEFACRDNPTITGPSFVSCPVGDRMIQRIFFPQCWDGVNLDSPDHKSHMAYPNGGCPASHPVPLPEFSIHIYYPITVAGEENHWRLSSDTYSGPAGYSSHADWMNGWNQSIMEAWVKNCDNPSLDCHSHLLGDGRMLY